VSAWFHWAGFSLGLNDVLPEVGGYGVRPFHVGHAGKIGEDEWQTNFKLPPGLTPGWHDVRIRIGRSLPGAAQRIAVDVPLAPEHIQIEGLSDGTTWEKGRLDLSRGNAVSLWVSGLPENTDYANLCVKLEGRRLPVIFIEAGAESARQINAEVPDDVSAGPASFSVTVGPSAAASAAIEIVRCASQ
jgi:hypothetical protein